MENKKDLSIVNCLATGFLAYFLTVPVHEFFHLLTCVIYGNPLLFYSASAVDAVMDYEGMSVFDRIMDAGGSASILNAIIGVILMIILLKCKMGPLMRVFLTQLMGAQFCQGVGYFLIGGLFGVGDWANVYAVLSDVPGVVTALRVILSIVGAGGIVFLFFLLNYMSYYFIEDRDNKKERVYVGFRLHFLMLPIGCLMGIIVTLLSPAVATGELSIGLGFLFDFMWIPFLWGFLFTGPMKTLPPKKKLFQYSIPKKPNWVLFIIGLALILVDIFVFGPGIKLS